MSHALQGFIFERSHRRFFLLRCDEILMIFTMQMFKTNRETDRFLREIGGPGGGGGRIGDEKEGKREEKRNIQIKIQATIKTYCTTSFNKESS